VLALEVSRLAGSNTDWYRLLDLAGLTDTLLAIPTQVAPFRDQLTRLQTIPGVGEVIIAETGGDMTRFQDRRTPGLLGRHLPWPSRVGRTIEVRPHPTRQPLARRRPGGRGDGRLPHEGHDLIGARYRRLVPRLAPQKALVALQHSILVAAWNVLSDGVDYADLSGDYFARRDPAATIRRLTRQANALGFTVRLEPITARRSRIGQLEPAVC
jgi:transposase